MLKSCMSCHVFSMSLKCAAYLLLGYMGMEENECGTYDEREREISIDAVSLCRASLCLSEVLLSMYAKKAGQQHSN